ncbi:acyl-CoA Delta-9 desaturase [Lucilia cuprina]|uniref:acyl-CoA Delta-9 desaturase n=1 Tax=Lucilia cuprina TaxID=7375 RepID=UPI001F057C59|nr:acyl-CoA Delta-9 desaturase [Lucilia cuprina]XP_023308967.2 acyl-CoA Delta-9 desaturase [Lucilia cuprina]
MCLSTPTTSSNGNNTSTACSSSPCTATNNDATANGDVSACGTNQKQHTELDCNGNTKTTTVNNNSIKQRKVTTAGGDAQNDTTAKDLVDNLGYKEENAVYKEIAAAKEVLKQQKQVEEPEKEFKAKIRWPDLGAQLFLHVGGLYGFYLLFSAKFYTFLWVVFTIWASGIGITAGAHRLWSHKSYNASLPLRILLIFLFTIAGQRDAYTWALDHRIHHKFSETEADPHNAKRGFFFAHVGWLFLTAHPKVEEKRKVIDMSDLENDGVVMFQRKWFIPLFAICSIALPVLVPWYFWNECLWSSFWINFNMRFTSTLNVAFFVNSVAHMWGKKPYDKNISPVESPIVSFLALGEGWHNYHHVFPWDYKTGEFGNYKLNVTTGFIDLCARLGLATGRKFVSPDMIKRRALKCGDGTRFLSDDYAHKDQVWGYGDKDLPQEDLQELQKMKS